MTELRRKIKTAVNETRILVLGAQILLGFQFQSAFGDGFKEFPARDRYADLAALVLLLAALASLIAPSAFHRIAEAGEDSGRVHRFASVMATVALLPFAVSFGLNLAIAADRIYGAAAGLSAGAITLGIALICWYAIEWMRRGKFGKKERAMSQKQSERRSTTPLSVKIDQMLVEGRVILPGAQALLGFQLAIVVTRSFEELGAVTKLVHLAGLGLVTLTVILLMAPAAYHRLVYDGEDTQEFHSMGTFAVTAATVPLALGISADVYVVVMRIMDTLFVSILFAAMTAIGFVGLWHVYPLLVRMRTESARAKHTAIPKGLSP